MNKILCVAAALFAIIFTIRLVKPSILKDRMFQTVVVHSILATSIPYWFGHMVQ